jgi:hypothetical protein
MIYGHKWSAIAEADDGTWLQGLRGLSPDQVAHGLSMLVDDFHEWPPSLPEFKKLCIDFDNEILDYYIEYRAFIKLDSFAISQLSQRKRDDMVRKVTEQATRDYFKSKFNDIAQINLDQLKIK